MKPGKLYCPYGHGVEHQIRGVNGPKGEILRDPFCRECRTYEKDGITVKHYGLLAYRPIYDMGELADIYVKRLVNAQKTKKKRRFFGLIK